MVRVPECITSTYQQFHSNPHSQSWHWRVAAELSSRKLPCEQWSPMIMESWEVFEWIIVVWHHRWCQCSLPAVFPIKTCLVKHWAAACKDEGWMWSQPFPNLWDSEASQGPIMRTQQRAHWMCLCRKRQTPTHLQEIWSKYLLNSHKLSFCEEECLLPFQCKLLTWVVVSKKGSESPKSLLWSQAWDNWRSNTKGCYHTSLIFVICVLPILPTLGGFNKTKNVKVKPNLFFKKNH